MSVEAHVPASPTRARLSLVLLLYFLGVIGVITLAPFHFAVPRDVHKPLADAQLQHDPEMGEIRDDDALTSEPDASAAPEGFDFGAAGETISEHVRRIDDALAIAAAKGSKALKEAWGFVEKSDQPLMKASLDRRHKPAAAAADKAAAIG